MWIAGISGDEFTILCFVRVGRIVEPCREGLQSGFSFVDVHGDNSSDGDKHISFQKVKKRAMPASTPPCPLIHEGVFLSPLLLYNIAMNILQKIFSDHYEEIKYTLKLRPSTLENIEKMIHCSDPSFGGAMYVWCA